MARYPGSGAPIADSGGSTGGDTADDEQDEGTRSRTLSDPPTVETQPTQDDALRGARTADATPDGSPDDALQTPSGDSPEPPQDSGSDTGGTSQDDALRGARTDDTTPNSAIDGGDGSTDQTDPARGPGTDPSLNDRLQETPGGEGGAEVDTPPAQDPIPDPPTVEDYRRGRDRRQEAVENPPERDISTETVEDEREIEELFAEQSEYAADEIDAYRQDGEWEFRLAPEHAVDEVAADIGVSERGIDVEQTGRGTYEYSLNEFGAEQRFAAQDENIDAGDIDATRQEDGTWVFEPTDQAGEAALRELTGRASQSPSLGTTGLGTTGTPQSRRRERTPRASQSVSLGTTGLGTTGTEQSRTRERTSRASQSPSLGTTGVGAITTPPLSGADIQPTTRRRGERRLARGTASTPDGAPETVAGAETLTSDDNRFDRMLGDFDEQVSRTAIDVIDVVFQEPEELGLPDQGEYEVSGPTVGGRSGPSGTLNREVTDELTEGKGLIPTTRDEGERGFFRTSERQLRSRIERRREILTPFAEGQGAAVEAITGSEKAGNVAEGVAKAPVEIVSQGGAGGLLIADTAVEVGSNLSETVEEYGAGTVAYAGAEVAGRATKGIIAQAEENPYETGGEAVGGFLTGATAFKALEKAPDAVRAARLARRDSVKFEDITTERAAETGELPRFDTAPDAETGAAVAEVRRRAADNPDVVTEKTGGETLYHGTRTNFGPDLEVGEGASELPGLFTSPEASTIALAEQTSSLSLSSIKPALPDVSSDSPRFAGLPGDRVRGMPEGRGGAGYELRDVDSGEQIQGGMGRGEAKAAAEAMDAAEVRPDQTTTGYDYLTTDAAPDTAYVRPAGQRTSELEAIFPPESQFRRTGRVNVRVGQRQVPGTDTDIPFTGRNVPLDTYRRVDGDTDPELGAATGGRVVQYDELTSSLSRAGQQPEGSAATGGGLVGSTAGVMTGEGTASSTTTAAPTSGSPTVVGPSITPAGVDEGVGSSPTATSDQDSSAAPTTTEVSSPTSISTSSITGEPSRDGTLTSSPERDVSPPTSVTTASSPVTQTPSPPSTGGPSPPGSPGPTPTTPPSTGGPSPPGESGPPASSPPSSPPPTTPPSGTGTPWGGSPPSLTPGPPSKSRRREDDDSRGSISITGSNAPTPSGEDVLVPGWYEEMATKLATGGGVSDIAPTQDQLESEAVSDQAVGTLPTKQFFGDEETREEIEDAQEFLSFGTVGGSDEEDEEDSFFEFGDGSDDSDDSNDEDTGTLLGF